MRRRAIVLDIETGRSDLLSVGWQVLRLESRGPTDYPTACHPQDVPDDVWDMLADPSVPVIEFTKYDAWYLLSRGYTLRGPVWDLQVMAWLLDENQALGLEPVVGRYLNGEKMDKRLSRKDNVSYFRQDDGKKVVIDDAPRDQLYDYCARDVGSSSRLFYRLRYLMTKSGWWRMFVDEEVPFTSVLLDMELAGMPINMEKSNALRDELEEKHEGIKRDLLLQAGLPKVFNINSDPQLRKYLFTDGFDLSGKIAKGEPVPEGFTPEKEGLKWVSGTWWIPGRGLRPGLRSEKTGAPLVSKDALLLNPATNQDSWCLTYLQYSKLETLLGTYLRKFPKIVRDGRIFANFNQTGTRTGRLSSSDTNLQNIPVRGEYGPRMRGIFEAPESHPLLISDFNQLEPRLYAHFSGDPFLMDVYLNDKDIYGELGRRVWGKEITKGDPERDMAKLLVLGMGYGAMGKKVSYMLTKEGYPTTPATGKEYVKELRGIVPVFFEWREYTIAEAKRCGYVETIGGHRRRLSAELYEGGWKLQGYGERAAANARVQGSAGDIVRRVMVRFRRDWLRLLVQVHDELLYQYLRSPSAEDRLIDMRALQEMGERGHGFDLRVPLRFEPTIGVSWAAK